MLLLLQCLSPAAAGTLYRYRDEAGRWVFTDREPTDGRPFVREARPSPVRDEPEVVIRRGNDGEQVRLFAANGCVCPVQVAVRLTGLRNVRSSAGNWIVQLVPARGELELAALGPAEPGRAWSFGYDYSYVFGDPDAVHRPPAPYRPPFGAARRYRVTQAWPDAFSHDTPDSRYAIDIAMPERSAVHAARGGLVTAVAHTHFKNSTDRSQAGAEANLVRVLHDDGTFAIYAHLSWDSIRVRPGQRIRRGEYIADSGNTGFSTGPHLHFAVLRNSGLRLESVPVRFDDGSGGRFTARTGDWLANP